MHLFYNIQTELLRHHLSGLEDGFALRSSDIPFLDEELLSFASGISGQLAVKPRELSIFNRWKAAEHKIFTLSYCLIIFDGYLGRECLDGLQLFVCIVDLCFRSSITMEQASDVKRMAIRFIEHFESYYVRHEPSRVNYCKYVLHLLLHLGDALVQYGPLMNAGQYWVEKYIGWILERSNAKRLPAKSMLKASWFGEAKRLFFKERFIEPAGSDLSGTLDNVEYEMRGPMREFKLSDIEEATLKDMIASYLVRKHSELEPSSARCLSDTIEAVRLWSRLIFLSGADCETASSENCISGFVKQRQGRPGWYVSVEMDATETTADVYYGKIRRLFEVDLQQSQYPELVRFNGKYKLALIQWAERLSKGPQGQVFKTGSRNAVFGSSTVEDVSIIRRLIGVVEHCVPIRSRSTAQSSSRKRRQTYFVDDFQRIDHLLSPTKSSDDGLNRRLKGMTRS